MRLTRRGWTALVIAGLAVALAWLFSPRGLNAVAAPLVVALAVGAIQVWRAPAPAVESEGVAAGTPGEERTRTLSVSGGGLARVTATLPDGLTGEVVDDLVALPDTIEQHCRLATRGVYEFEPVAVTQRDSLGLVATRRSLSTDDEVVVYPETYALGGHPALADLFREEYTAERQAFDSLREYVPGDPLRNVHWKSSAKYDDYLVMEFDPDDHHETVVVAADADEGAADEMASAAASVAVAALDAGRGVEVVVPGGRVGPGTGAAQREAVLELLARTGPGTLDAETRARADVAIQADDAGTTVQVGETRVSLAALRRGPPTGAREVVA
jgi:uncharacterized protein (DUF58 family)